MDTPDWEEQEKLRRRKETVEYRTKKTRSTIFMVCASVFEILETLLIMIALFLLVSFVLFKLFDPNLKAVQIAFEVLSIVVFLGSMIGGFFVYKAVMKLVITKFNLKEKLSDDVISHYIKPEKNETEEQLKR